MHTQDNLGVDHQKYDFLSLRYRLIFNIDMASLTFDCRVKLTLAFGQEDKVLLNMGNFICLFICL